MNDIENTLLELASGGSMLIEATSAILQAILVILVSILNIIIGAITFTVGVIAIVRVVFVAIKVALEKEVKDGEGRIQTYRPVQGKRSVR